MARSLIKYLFYVLLAVLLLVLIKQIVTGKLFDSSEKEVSVHHMVVQQIEEMGSLELVKFRIKDVVEESIERSWLQGGDTKVLVVVGGEAVGCVNLKAVKPEDIIEDEQRITLNLPQPEICYAKVNHEDSKIFYAPTSPFAQSGEAVDKAYRNAEAQIRAAALEMGILQQARENAQKVLTPILQSISGGKEVLIVFKPERANTPEQAPSKGLIQHMDRKN